MRARTKGFTLIELMVVVAVIAILAAIAMPSFREQSAKGRRSDAASSLGSMQLALERWRADNPSYANSSPASASYPAFPTSAYYDFAFSGTTNATGYTITATPKSSGPQHNDRCGVLTATATTKPTWAGTDCP